MSESVVDPAFHYHLPDGLIARDPAAHRPDAHLMHWDGRADRLVADGRVADLPDLLEPGDVLVVNDSRVLPARLRTRRPPGGGRVEILLTAPLADGSWRALARPAKKLAVGTVLDLETDDGLLAGALEVLTDPVDGEVTVAAPDADVADLAEAHGVMPLPPYITSARRDEGRDDVHPDDRERYQTVYARDTGSVAAPTAGLHFDDGLLARLAARGVAVERVTLHVGIGTFRNPDARDLADARLHAESFRCPASVMKAVAAARDAGRRVIAVGTTSLRVLETVARLDLPAPAPGARLEFGAGEARPLFEGEAVATDEGWNVAGRTRLFLRPPDVVTAADGLLTNFHLPGSSLLMLVACAAPGWRGLYDEAVARGRRFYSYGDAGLIMPLATPGGDAP